MHNSEPERKWLPVRKRLVDALGEEMTKVIAPISAKRLSILVTGYEYSHNGEVAAAVPRDPTPSSVSQA